MALTPPPQAPPAVNAAGRNIRFVIPAQAGICHSLSMEEKFPAFYILAHKPHGVLYVGVTSALWNRVAAHKQGEVKGFTQKYNVKLLVWYEHHHFIENAIKREKQIKEWKREWKIELIENFNPAWADLHDRIDPVGTLVEFDLAKDSGLRRNDKGL
jgi:putative endonuclease